MDREKLVEKMARTIGHEINANYDAQSCKETSNGVEPWEERAWLEDTARSALAAIEASGFWLAPEEPTDGMIDAAVMPDAEIITVEDRIRATYQAMQKAARRD